MYSNHLLQLHLWRCFKDFTKYHHLLLWPNRKQYYFHIIHKVTYKKCKQISYQWDPCFSCPAPNLFRVVQTVVTISENHNKCMAVRKLDIKYHPSSTCSQNVNFCMDTTLMSFSKSRILRITIKIKQNYWKSVWLTFKLNQ